MSAGVRCPLCAEADVRHEELYSEMLDLPGHTDARVQRCASCRFLFLHPYVSDEFLTELYAKDYFTGEAAGASGNGVEFSPHEPYQSCVNARLQKFDQTLDLMERFVARPRRILDVGAATGDFLAIARGRGYEVAGIELSEYAAAEARRKHGLELHTGFLESYESSEQFDVIHLNHVLEHLPDPGLAVRTLDSLLAPGGGIYIEVPQQFSVVEVTKYRLTRRTTPFSLFSVHHPVFYRAATLTALFAKHGFERRFLRRFDAARYASSSTAARLKSATWSALALLDQGIFLEAVFTRAPAR